MDGCIREMKVRVLKVEQPFVAGLYADDTVLLAESEGMLQRIVDELERVCRSRKLKVNTGKSKVMVFERAREQTIDFAKPYRVGSEATPGCKGRCHSRFRLLRSLAMSGDNNHYQEIRFHSRAWRLG